MQSQRQVIPSLKMSRMLSQESVAIVETQTSALFGDIRKLQEQMQNAVGQDVSSYEELMARVQVRPDLPDDLPFQMDGCIVM